MAEKTSSLKRTVRHLKVALWVLMGLLVLIIVVHNRETTPLNLLGWEPSLPLFAWLLAALLVGLVLGTILGGVLARRRS